jgi:transcriptional regulator with XRE-family HTH domain
MAPTASILRADPQWWISGMYEGRPLRNCLAEQDIQSLFLFLRNHGYSRSMLAAATGITETRVRSIAQGKQLVRSYDVLMRIADGLGIDRGLLGLSHVSAGPDRGSSRLRDPGTSAEYVGALAALAVGPVPAELNEYVGAAFPDPGSVPALVTAAHVDLVRAVRDEHRHIDATCGGGSCRDSAVNYLAWASGMLASRFDSEQIEAQFKSALSDMYQVAGWASHDLGDHAAARHYLTTGLVLARQINELALIAGGFYRLGRVSIHQGRAQEALRLWQLGQIVAQDSGNLAAVAVLHANEAWAYAMLGAADRVSDSLARARDELGRVDEDTVPAWARFFLAPADLDGISGVIYGCLASHPEHRRRFAPLAIEHAERSYSIRAAGEERSRTFDAISIATGYFLDAQPDRATDAGHQAVDLALATDSVRAADRLQSMVSLASPYTTHSGVNGVLERVGALVGG